MINQYDGDAIGLPVMAGPEEATAIGNCMVQAMLRIVVHAQL